MVQKRFRVPNESRLNDPLLNIQRLGEKSCSLAIASRLTMKSHMRSPQTLDVTRVCHAGRQFGQTRFDGPLHTDAPHTSHCRISLQQPLARVNNQCFTSRPQQHHSVLHHIQLTTVILRLSNMRVLFHDKKRPGLMLMSPYGLDWVATT